MYKPNGIRSWFVVTSEQYMNQTNDIRAILFDYGGVLAEEGITNAA
jgi:hypothetical protein